MLTIFYDGNCALCAREMYHLMKMDKQGNIQFEDLHQPDFSRKFPDIDQEKAMDLLHGKLRDDIIVGLDVTYHAWRLVGKEHWVKPLQCAVLKPAFNRLYHLFAKNRHTIAKFFYPEESCDNGQCYRPTKRNE